MPTPTRPAPRAALALLAVGVAAAASGAPAPPAPPVALITGSDRGIGLALADYVATLGPAKAGRFYAADGRELPW